LEIATSTARGSAEAQQRAQPAAVADPTISVVVCAYNSRDRIDLALGSLRDQDFDEPYEVVVVDSGSDGTSDYVQSAYPEVRVVRSPTRLFPGPARNVGVRSARGRYVAFLPDDGIARPDWLRRRVSKHREGYEAVGGAITNATPRHPVGSAGYYLEYSALIPSDEVLAEQAVPHCLSYDRSVFDRVGDFPEDTETGEDTLFNERCLAAGISIGFDAGVQLGHRNLKRVGPYLRHQVEHGRGLVQCVDQHGFESPVGPADQSTAAAMYRMFIHYPRKRWWNALKRIRRGRRRWAAGYLVVSPLVWAGLWATSVGAFREWRNLRRGRA
jgi:glycosyltransferase involved in cell wall biosynthesis